MLLYYIYSIFIVLWCRKGYKLKEKLQQLKSEAIERINGALGEDELGSVRTFYLGKKGAVTDLLKGLGALSAEERPAMGAMVNETREAITNHLEQKLAVIKEQKAQMRLKAERIDVSLPGNVPSMGKLHPMTKVLRELKEIFLGMGFEVRQGPEIELDRYNFEMLNMPKTHPARDTQDTFYINEEILLRTQTSPMQIRTMEVEKPPIRIIVPGRVYRSDAVDASHSPIFHQIEGLVVDKGITFTNLKNTLETFTKKLYGDDCAVRFRPHHFPYTEPSAEMDATCFKCGGSGCGLCKGEGFIELLGCGMVHPNVLAGCGIDPEVYSGFAFGVGLERITMLRYGIDDMRLLYDGDLRFLDQF